MVKTNMNTNTIWALLLVGLIIFMYSQSSEPTSTDNNIDLADAVDSSASFTGQDLYLKGTSLNKESVKIIKYINGNAELDLGYVSLDSGAQSTTPNAQYKFYFGMNNTPSVNYYVSVVDYTAPIQDAVDDVMGKACKIDTTPTFSVRNSDYNTQTSSSNAQSVVAGGDSVVFLRIKASSDKCYGMPDAPKGNAICFAYNSTVLRVKTNTGSVGTPTEISGNVTGKSISCYEFPVIQDGEDIEIVVNLHGMGEATTAHNVSVYSDDIAFDLNGDTLSEIYGYQDEKGNSLASEYLSLGTIYIS